MDDRFDNEIQALLSAYAAGTLTPDEKKRLFEKSLSNQQLFDALADEEAMRAALATPLVKASLIEVLEKTSLQEDEIHASAPLQSKPNTRLLWAAVAVCLLFGIISVTLWPTKPVVQVAEVKQPVLVAENKPTPEPAPTPVPAPARPIEKHRSVAVPQPAQEKLADQPTATPVAPAIAPAESEFKAKKEAEDVKASADSRASAALPAPKQSIAVSADSALKSNAAERQANRFNAPAGQLGAGASSIAKVAPIAAISRNNLAVNAAATSHVYAFVIDGATIRALAPTDEAKRLYPLGDHSAQSEVWLLVTPSEDPVLERALTGVLPLPTRNWTKLKTNP